eukprot:g30186.t1
MRTSTPREVNRRSEVVAQPWAAAQAPEPRGVSPKEARPPPVWDTLSIATPSSTDEAIQRLSVAIASAQPLLFRGGAHEARPGFFGWASDSWAPQELQERFGELKIDGGYDATLSDFLDSFFEGEDPPSPKKSCFSGEGKGQIGALAEPI